MTGFPPEAQLQWDLTLARFREWLQGDVFTLHWQLIVALFLLTTWLWWKKVDRSRLAEMVLYSAVVIIFVIVLDQLGEELTLWYYPVAVLPLFPPAEAVNVSCLPLVYMLIYQHTKHWKTFILATLVMSILFCFVCEPIFVLGGAYVPLKWEYWYGLPVYFLIGLAARLIIRRIYRHPSEKRPV